MRLASILLLASACDYYEPPYVSPTGERPLRLRQVQRYEVHQDHCYRGPDGGCDVLLPTSLAVAIVSGDAVAITGPATIATSPPSFELTAIAIGRARIAVTGTDDESMTFTVEVSPFLPPPDVGAR